MRRISAILLAAGESLRMGDVNKLTLAVGGAPLLRHMVTRLLDSELHEIVVVTGHEQETARTLLQGLPVTLVSNARYREGQMTSVYRGMEALSEPCDGVMGCPVRSAVTGCRGSQPAATRLSGAVSDDGAGARLPSGRGEIPSSLAYQHRDAILGGERNLGCRRLIEKNPELVTTLEMGNDHVVFDLDTPVGLPAPDASTGVGYGRRH